MFSLLSLAQTSACATAEDRARSLWSKCNAALLAPLVWLSQTLAAAFAGAKTLRTGERLKHYAAMFARVQLHAPWVNPSTHTLFPRLPFLGGKIGAHWGAVLRLLCTSSPFAVARRIRSVVISTFQREALRSRGHIIVKVIERLAPSSANANSARSVPPIHRMGGIGAPSAHLPPNAVEGMEREPAALFVCHGALYHVS